jgi:hypothetical protein
MAFLQMNLDIRLKKMFKILCTGNPGHEGIAKAVSNLFDNVTFVSRSSGYDFNTQEGLSKLENILPEYNVLINNSHVNYGVKKTILELARNNWRQGRVINIGSYCEIKKYSVGSFKSAQDAIELRELGFELTTDEFQVTHIIVGPFRSEVKPMSFPNMDAIHIANTIKYVLLADYQIPITSVMQINDYFKLGMRGMANDYYSKNINLDNVTETEMGLLKKWGLI